MKRIMSLWNDLEIRRRVIVVMSGLLISAAFVRFRVFDDPAVRDALMIIAALVAGTDIAIRAIRALWRKQVTIELLVTIAATGALIIGEYWESAAVTFLFVFGAWLEARTIHRTRASLAKLIKLAPSTALVVTDGNLVETPLYEVESGDEVMVRAGESIPVDGVVTSGTALVSEAAITGEPLPVAKSVGDQVFTGTIAEDAAITVKAESVGADSLLGRIVARVEEAQDAKAPVQTTIERFATWYTPAIILLALGFWLATRDTHLALTILVIGCPGALVIATPVAFVAAIGRAASLGILIKGGEFLENVSRVTVLALDKTGTITHGKPELTDIQPIGSHSRHDVLLAAAIAEQGSTHPLAHPIVAQARSEFLDIPLADTHDVVIGQGVRARWNNEVIAVGTPELMRRIEVGVPNVVLDQLVALQQQGKTVALVSRAGSLMGVIGVQDQHRQGVEMLAEQLREVGVRRTVMLTGDNKQTAEAIGRAAGIHEVHARQLPDDKLEWVRRAQAGGDTVAMVGDGINDAPALAVADVSIAMGAAGTDVALETANIALMNDNPMRIVDALRISRRTRSVIKQNLAIAVGTVLMLLTGVLLRQVNMAGGMLVHEASVMIVILNAMRLMRA